MKDTLTKKLCDSLFYTFDEEACVNRLDIEKTVDNLLAAGVTVSPRIEIMKDVVNIEEDNHSSCNRLVKINGYKRNSELLKATAEQKVQDEADSLVEQIQALKPRIDELIATGNACLENGIELDAYHNKGWFNRSDDSYERGTFVTNSISHKVGFVKTWGQYDKKAHSFTELGINNGGACGHYNFRTDGERIYFVNEDDKTDIKDASHRIKDLKEFLDEFNKFESAFYSYVDKVIEKQQKSVDAIIAEAKGRVVETPSGAREHDIDK